MNSEPSSEEDIFDRQKLLEKFDNDEEFFDELLECYLEDVPIHLNGLRHCLREKTYDQAERWAHTIKGASANMEAEEMRKSAFDLEMVLKDKDFDQFEKSLKYLEDSFQRFLRLIKKD